MMEGGARWEMEASTEAVLRAVQALHETADRDMRRAANSWLEQFQQSIQAWQIADQMLHDPNTPMEVRHFCALTLRMKVQRDFEELPPGSSLSLRSSLLKLLLAHKNGPAPVRTQLCLAIAALAAHTPVQAWEDSTPGTGIAGGAPQGATPSGVVTWLQNQLGSQPDSVPALLEVLTVLVQEVSAYKLAVKPEQRRQFSTQLVTAAPQVFSMLAACYTSAPSDTKLTNSVLLAFAAWLKFSPGVAASVLMSSPLLAASLQGLKSTDTFDAAVEAVLELIRFTVVEGPSALASNMALVQLLVPSIMDMRPRFRAAVQAAKGEDVESDDDEDSVKAIARLFAEMGEAYVELIASGSGEAMMIAEALVEVTTHPEFDIASTTFNFWHLLSSYLTQRPRHSFTADIASDAVAAVEHDRRLAAFRPTFEILLSLVAFRVRFPEDYEKMRKDEKADFKQSRYAVAEVLNDVQQVLGGDRTLELLTEPLFQMARAAAAQQQGGSFLWDWRSAEASLFCVRAIAGPTLLENQSTLPQVMGLLPSLPREPLLLYTVSLTIAAYCEWLAASPQAAVLLPPLLTLLTSALASPGEPPPAAALALKHVCDACKQQLVASIEALIQLYTQVVSPSQGVSPPNPVSPATTFPLETEDQLQVVEAVSLVVSVLPGDQCLAATMRLCAPGASQLEAVISAAQINGPNAQPTSSQYILQIDRFAHIFRYVGQPNAVAAAFQKLWPMFQAVFTQRAGDTRVMERLCRACKFGVRNGKAAIAPALGPLLEELKSKFALHHQSCLLYVASEVVKVFGRDPSCASYLQALMMHLFSQTTALLQGQQAFTNNPDIADDCFLLASRCMRYCGHLLVPTPAYAALVDCALLGMFVQHREACKSILSFLRDSVELLQLGSSNGSGTSSNRENRGTGIGQQDLSVTDSDMRTNGRAADMMGIPDDSTAAGRNALRQAAEAVLLPRGPLLCQMLLAACTGALPESRNDDVIDLLAALLHGFGNVALQWLQPLLAAIPPQVLSDSEKTQVLHAAAAAAASSSAAASGDSHHLHSGLSSRECREQLLSAMDDFSGACRRNKKASQLVQSALLPQFARQT